MAEGASFLHHFLSHLCKPCNIEVKGKKRIFSSSDANLLHIIVAITISITSSCRPIKPVIKCSLSPFIFSRRPINSISFCTLVKSCLNIERRCMKKGRERGREKERASVKISVSKALKCNYLGRSCRDN
jgi:hypothetical protein